MKKRKTDDETRLANYSFALGQIKKVISKKGFITLKDSKALLGVNHVTQNLANYACKAGALTKMPPAPNLGKKDAYYILGIWPNDMVVAKEADQLRKEHIAKNRTKYVENRKKKRNAATDPEMGQDEQKGQAPGESSTEEENTQEGAQLDLELNGTQYVPDDPLSHPDIEEEPETVYMGQGNLGTFTLEINMGDGTGVAIDVPAISMDLIHDLNALQTAFGDKPKMLRVAVHVLMQLHSGEDYFDKVKNILQICRNGM